MQHVSARESFKASLGVDSALRVTYPASKTLNRTAAQSGFLFMSKEEQSVSAQSQRITIRNTRPPWYTQDDAHGARVGGEKMYRLQNQERDLRLYTSRNRGRSNNKNKQGACTRSHNTEERKRREHLWKDVQKGVKARWAPLEAGEGTVEWSCDIAPSDEAGLELAWELSTPAGQKWQDL
ncbi:hypothetical protein FRC11_002011 [Ceratobasidium sp. 423]|nr:hypothetical protein FRC11_002011 [Ceratobasidium sp. 423]